MTIIRVFPRRTALTPRDDLAFVGDPPMFRPAADEVHVSVTFTWDRQEAERLADAWRQYYPVVKIGGPAVDHGCNGFLPGRYVKPGVTFTSRGCNNDCPWCLVPEREGALVEYEDFTAGNIVNDNNLLQCRPRHLDQVFRMLRGQHLIHLSGGLESWRVTDDIADQVRGVAIRQLFLAADTHGSLKPLKVAVRRLTGLSRQKLRCYVLLGFNGETTSEAIARLEDVWAVGCMPYAQLYQPPDRFIEYSSDWKAIMREWSRPAAMVTNHKGG